MAVREVTCAMPSGTLIVKNLSISINAREHLVIHGPSGCGKTTLLRYMKGLWFLKNRHGAFDSQLMNSSTSGIMFCPQDPFVFPATLQTLITFPRDAPHLSQISWESGGSSAVQSAFERLELSHLIDPAYGWATRRNWSQELSLGEKQRISFLRILYHRPQLAILDESTSALSTELETICYTVVKDAGDYLFSVFFHGSLPLLTCSI
jgi:ATP-binding cassette subfamily D (ALD) long-chain fatty acid import protein